MNENKKFYNLKEVENKLHNFQEGKDYFVTLSREPEIKDYTFFNDRLKSLFGGNNWVPVRVWQEKYDGKEVKYRGHFEEGKNYSYSFQGWDYGANYQGDRGTEYLPESFESYLKGIEWNKHSRIEVHGEAGNFKTGQKYWERKWTYDGKGNGKSLGAAPGQKGIGLGRENWEIDGAEKVHSPEIPCATCKKPIKLNQGHFICKEHKEHHCSSECANQWYKCHMEWVPGKENNNSTSLEKENYELRHQLAQVQAELAKVLAELKNLTGKGDKKLEQQQAENEKAIKQGSVAEIKAQVQKSQALVREAGTQTKEVTPKKNESGNSVFPYVAVSSLLVAGLGGVVFWWKKHSSKK